jgi:hypothetical protein
MHACIAQSGSCYERPSVQAFPPTKRAAVDAIPALSAGTARLLLQMSRIALTEQQRQRKRERERMRRQLATDEARAAEAARKRRRRADPEYRARERALAALRGDSSRRRSDDGLAEQSSPSSAWETPSSDSTRAEKQAARRAHETPEARQKRLEADAERHRRLRAQRRATSGSPESTSASETSGAADQDAEEAVMLLLGMKYHAEFGSTECPPGANSVCSVETQV